MTIRTKALIIMGVSLLVMAGMLYISSRIMFLRGLEKIEEQQIIVAVEMVLNDLNHIISDMDTNTVSFASLHDTYSYMEELNGDFIESHFTAELFISSRFNAVIVLDTSDQIVFRRAVDIKTGETITETSVLLQRLSNDDSILNQIGENNFLSGIILFKEGPVLISWQPILTRQGEGPSRGTIVIARKLDDSEIAYLSTIASFPVTLHPLAEIVSPDLKEARRILLAGEKITVEPVNSEVISGYTLVRDIFGKPVIILRMDVPRDISQLGQAVIVQFIILLLGFGVLLSIGTMYVIQNQILSRFTRLIQGVNHIADTGDTSIPITLDGKDELNLVAGTINGMLVSLEETISEIKEREERYRDLFENTADLIYSVSPDGHFLYVNDAWERTLGYSQEEARELSPWDIIHPDYTPRFMELFQKVFTGEAPTTVEAVFVTKDGQSITVEGNISYQYKEQEIVAIRGIFRDITERKQAADRLQALYLQERDLRQQLEEEIQKRLEYTRALVHELKTPITPIIAATELLLDEIKDENQLRLVQSIERSAANLNRRIDDLLDLARGELNMLELNLESIDLVMLLGNITREMTPVALKKGQTLTFNPPASIPFIMADVQRVQQVVDNLINNAIKFTHPEGEITLSARQDNNDLIVEVSDTGNGIKEEEQKRLFEPYYRKPDDKERLSGLGLGLALAKNLVELHGGRIWVISQEGEGSIFGFSLPLNNRDADTQDSDPGGK